jgi:CheY-like chemotaxis protein
MGKKAIICIDDERTIQKSLKGQLTRRYGNKFTYEFADNPEEGLEVIEELVEDGLDLMVVVSDWMMPGMKGDEFLVRVHEKYPQVSTVMLSGQADKDAVERAKNEANLSAFISKPWSEEELFRELDKHVTKD